VYQVYGSGLTGTVNRPSPGKQIQAQPIKVRFLFLQSVSYERNPRCERKPDFHIKSHLPNPRKAWKFQKNRECFHPLRQEIVSGR
jgi:hypothetical protein